MPEAALEIGVVCGRCDAFAPLGTSACPRCAQGLALEPPPARPAAAGAGEGLPKPPGNGPRFAGSPPPAEPSASEDQMDQAKYYVCVGTPDRPGCMTPVPSGHKFCGRCGMPVPDDVLHMNVYFYGDMQDPARARLILIRGDGMEGVSYHLKAEEHAIGREGEIEFPDDPFISPRHANLFYRDGRLVVRDEGSLNGVFVRVRGAVELSAGDCFVAGEQLFRVDPTPRASDSADSDGTFFYSSPKYPSSFRLNQILDGGSLGMTVCALGTSLNIGREDGDLNFPGDVYMSARHCTVEEREGRFVLTDHDSRNGTYVRIKAEQPLTHGDYLFVGKKLLRVELNSN
ncbi:MAG: FHA domain-containing protein [Polyangiaceae bacterium]|nr:FHA domain-containing protein [Polyangiaceae bacterium]